MDSPCQWAGEEESTSYKPLAPRKGCHLSLFPSSCLLQPQPSCPPAGSNLTVIFQEPCGCAREVWLCCLTLLLLTSSLASRTSAGWCVLPQQTLVAKFSFSYSRERGTEAPSNVLHCPRRHITRVRGELWAATRWRSQQGTEQPAVPSSPSTHPARAGCCSPALGIHGTHSPTAWPHSNSGKYCKPRPFTIQKSFHCFSKWLGKWSLVATSDRKPLKNPASCRRGKSTSNIYKLPKLCIYTVWELHEFPSSYTLNQTHIYNCFLHQTKASSMIPTPVFSFCPLNTTIIYSILLATGLLHLRREH